MRMMMFVLILEGTKEAYLPCTPPPARLASTLASSLMPLHRASTPVAPRHFTDQVEGSAGALASQRAGVQLTDSSHTGQTKAPSSSAALQGAGAEDARWCLHPHSRRRAKVGHVSLATGCP